MQYGLNGIPFKDTVKRGAVGDIGFNQRSPLHGFPMSSLQIVNYDGIPAAMRHEFGGVAPDVAGAAGDEEVHESDVITLDLKWPPRQSQTEEWINPPKIHKIE
jgi:hypothetical protein